MGISYDQDKSILSLVPSDDQITAHVVAHMGASEEALATIKELKSFDKVLVGQYYALLRGNKLDLSEEERKKSLITGRLFEKLYNYVSSQHVLL